MSGNYGTLKKDVAKAAMLLVSLVIGLLCGDTLDAFYIAVLVQSLSNAYDSFEHIGVSSRLITGAYVITLLGAVLSFICAVLHFSSNQMTAFVNEKWAIVGVCVFLAIPFIIVAIKVFVTIRSGEY